MVPNPSRLHGLRLLDSADPYAYPYFHSDGTAPVLYQLAILFSSSCFAKDRLAKKIISRSLVRPQDITWRDSCGDTALHRLVQQLDNGSNNDDAPSTRFDLVSRVIKALVQACPSVMWAQNNWKETPLHQFVAHCGISCFNEKEENESPHVVLEQVMEVVRLMSHPRVLSCRNYLGATPLFGACELSQIKVQMSCWKSVLHTAIVKHLITQNPNAVSAVDNAGLTPLHRAVSSSSCGPQVVQVLLQHLMETKQYNHKALLMDLLQTLWKCYHQDKVSDTILASLQQNQRHDVAQSLAVDPLWEKTVLLLEAAYCNCFTKHHPFQLVHATIALDAPLCVVTLAVCLHAEQLLHVQEESGRTPLAMAVQGYFAGQRQRQQDGSLDVLQLLIGAESRAAAVVDHAGRLPLHMASESGLHWHDGLQTLFIAEPRAIAARDPVTLLYPFLLAAVERVVEEDSAREVETIYELLRADPSVMAFSSR